MKVIDRKKLIVKQDISLLEAIKLMNENSMQILIVVNEKNLLIGVVTDGDIRGAIVDNIDFNRQIISIMSRNPVTMKYPADKNRALKLMKKRSVKHIPIVDNDGNFIDLLLLNDFLKNGNISVNDKPNSVVIMAGGKGTRLDVFTKILPKPLIPIGEKPILEHILDNFAKHGFINFLISLNYKADMIKMYFSENQHKFNIDYVQEKEYLGTAGALSLAKEKLNDTFIVSNCDVIFDTDLERLFTHHKENKNHATILSTIQNIKIPYGVLKAQEGNLEEIIEKPEYTFLVNSGVYVFEPEIIDLIPENQHVDMTNLLMSAKQKGLKVNIYPMTCSWFDVGQWSEYKRAVDHLNAFKVD
jgi:dTDP-glucose pyrophosphorylase